MNSPLQRVFEEEGNQYYGLPITHIPIDVLLRLEKIKYLDFRCGGAPIVDLIELFSHSSGRIVTLGTDQASFTRMPGLLNYENGEILMLDSGADGTIPVPLQNFLELMRFSKTVTATTVRSMQDLYLASLFARRTERDHVLFDFGPITAGRVATINPIYQGYANVQLPAVMETEYDVFSTMNLPQKDVIIPHRAYGATHYGFPAENLPASSDLIHAIKPGMTVDLRKLKEEQLTELYGYINPLMERKVDVVIDSTFDRQYRIDLAEQAKENGSTVHFIVSDKEPIEFLDRFLEVGNIFLYTHDGQRNFIGFEDLMQLTKKYTKNIVYVDIKAQEAYTDVALLVANGADVRPVAQRDLGSMVTIYSPQVGEKTEKKAQFPHQYKRTNSGLYVPDSYHVSDNGSTDSKHVSSDVLMRDLFAYQPTIPETRDARPPDRERGYANIRACALS
ncbi:MAG: hypothetical protein HY832_00230 [Candidatus Aenigmarchaeota archaeon]|nr:hypothetical protein [Candidatus Aenigmarchaeota archaeon]